MNETAPVVVGAEPLALAAFPVDADADIGAATHPADHPRWQRDVVSISARARTVLAQLKPVALRVLSYWDHRVREIALGGRRLAVDPAGSYRLR
jgi:hypothetical protein